MGVELSYRPEFAVQTDFAGCLVESRNNGFGRVGMGDIVLGFVISSNVGTSRAGICKAERAGGTLLDLENLFADGVVLYPGPKSAFSCTTNGTLREGFLVAMFHVERSFW
jgi:hypothetical protein